MSKRVGGNEQKEKVMCYRM